MEQKCETCGKDLQPIERKERMDEHTLHLSNVLYRSSFDSIRYWEIQQ